MKQKFIDVLGSSNALLNVLSIFILALASNDIYLEQTPEELINMFSGKSSGELLTLVLINFFGPATKLVKKLMTKEWNWEFLKSANFQTQILSLLTILVSSLAGETLAGILVALVLQVWNLITHLLKPVKNV